MKKLLAVLLLMAFSGYAIDYQKSLELVKKYQRSFTEPECVSYMLQLAKSDAQPEVIAHAMAIYTLHAGSVGDSKACMSAYQSAVNRYPDLKTMQYLKALRLFPDSCRTCSGSGLVEQEQQKKCLTCNASGYCPKCKGAGRPERTGLRGPTHQGRSTTFNLKCLTCGGAGTCGTCGGNPIKVSVAKVPCTVCNGKKNEINKVVAKDALIRVTQDFRDLLQLACDCEVAYNKAIELKDPVKQAEELRQALSKYSQALNCSVIKDKLTKVSEVVVEAKEQCERQRREDEELLSFIQYTKTTRVAWKNIQAFINDRPNSPVIQKAKLLHDEIKARLEEEEAIATRNRFMYKVIGAIFVLGFIVWLASCIRFK